MFSHSSDPLDLEGSSFSDYYFSEFGNIEVSSDPATPFKENLPSISQEHDAKECINTLKNEDKCDEQISPSKRTVSMIHMETKNQNHDRKMENKPKRRRVARHLELNDIPEDGYNWRKYGQKQIKDSPNIRAYFACARKPKGCPAKKMVDRKLNEDFIRISYEGNHNHDAPNAPPRNATCHQRKGSDSSISSVVTNQPCSQIREVFASISMDHLQNQYLAANSLNESRAMDPEIKDEEGPNSKFFVSNSCFPSAVHAGSSASTRYDSHCKATKCSAVIDGLNTNTCYSNDELNEIIDNLWSKQNLEVANSVFETLEVFSGSKQDAIQKSSWEDLINFCSMWDEYLFEKYSESQKSNEAPRQLLISPRLDCVETSVSCEQASAEDKPGSISNGLHWDQNATLSDFFSELCVEQCTEGIKQSAAQDFDWWK